MSNIARQYANFQFVSFVSASPELGDNSVNNVCTPKSNLSGEEASGFYKDVISVPSSSQPKYSLNPHKRKSNSSKYMNSRLTIFHYAQNGDLNGIKYFLSTGCQIDVTDFFGWTPLMCATVKGQFLSAEYLIKNGADLGIKNKQGQTALDIAIVKKYGSLINLLKYGITEYVPTTDSKTEEYKYCELCKCSYKESLVSHESSIPHLLSSKKHKVSTFYHIPENNKGFQIMLRKGWDKNKGLGADANGRKFPIKTVLKSDRTCIGRKKEVSKVTHFGPNDYSSVKKHNQPGIKIVRERTYKKWESQKIQKKNRQKEINFRRQFNLE